MEPSEDQLPITGADRIVILKAEFRLSNACMAELGFPGMTGAERYAVPEPPAYLSPTELRRGGYQFDFAAEAAGELVTSGGRGALDPTKGMSPDEAEQYDVALNGSPDGKQVSLRNPDGSVASTSATGCLAQAREELYGSVRNHLRYDRQGSSDGGGLAKRLSRDAGYRSARRAWETCMAKASQPVDAGADYGVHTLRRRLWIQVDEGGGPLTDAEIRALAVADADCQESTGLFEIRERLLPGARKALAERFGLEQSDVVAFENAVLAKAKTVR